MQKRCFVNIYYLLTELNKAQVYIHDILVSWYPSLSTSTHNKLKGSICIERAIYVTKYLNFPATKPDVFG